MENEIKKLKLTEALDELEAKLIYYKAKMAKENGNMKDAEKDLARVKKMKNTYQSKIDSMNRRNEKMKSISNLNVINGLATKNIKAIKGKEYRKTMEHMDELISKCKSEYKKSDDKYNQYRKMRNSVEREIDAIKVELSRL